MDGDRGLVKTVKIRGGVIEMGDRDRGPGTVGPRVSDIVEERGHKSVGVEGRGMFEEKHRRCRPHTEPL